MITHVIVIVVLSILYIGSIFAVYFADTHAYQLNQERAESATNEDEDEDAAST